MQFILWFSSHFLSSEFISHTHTHNCLNWGNLNHTGTSSVSWSGKYGFYFSRLYCTLEKDPNRGWVDQSAINIFLNGFLIATPFSFSCFFSFLLLFVSTIRYCYGFYLAITLFWMYKLFTKKICGDNQGAWSRAAASINLWTLSQNISHIVTVSSLGAHSPSLGQTRQRNAIYIYIYNHYSIYILKFTIWKTTYSVNLSLVLLLTDFVIYCKYEYTFCLIPTLTSELGGYISGNKCGKY